MDRFNKVIFKVIVCLFALNCDVVAGMSAKSIRPQTDTFAVLKFSGFKRVRSLKEKNGEFLGYIYVKENTKYKNGQVLTALLVVKARGSKLDTLYEINSHGDLINTDGKIELKNHVKNYYGFKLAKEIKNITDLFSTGNVDSSGWLFSDDNDYLINWDYNTKKFVYYPAP